MVPAEDPRATEEIMKVVRGCLYGILFSIPLWLVIWLLVWLAIKKIGG